MLTCSLCVQTPNQYIRWRYASGEDRESVEKMSRQAQEEDEKAMQQQIKTEDGVKRILDKLLGRRKAKRSYEYEVGLALPAASFQLLAGTLLLFGMPQGTSFLAAASLCTQLSTCILDVVWCSCVGC